METFNEALTIPPTRRYQRWGYDRLVDVDSADREVRRLVRSIGSDLEADGGYVHPDLVVHHAGPHLWITLPRTANPYADVHLDRPAPDAPVILRVPNRSHIPVGQVHWVDDPAVLRYEGDPAGLSRQQRRILDSMVDLYNACDKVRSVAQSYPSVALRDDPELRAVIERARPGWSSSGPDSPVQLLVESRIRWETGEGDEDSQGYLMPMIDMLNHHPYGSRYEQVEDDWMVRTHHPGSDDQIYVRYNKADALGVALDLGYLEEATTFVASVPCEFTVPLIGRVLVGGASVSRRRIPAPAARRTDSGVEFAGIQLATRSLLGLVELVAMPLRAVNPTLNELAARTMAVELVADIAAANADYYELLAACPEEGGGAGGGGVSVRPLMRDVARHQLRLLADLRLHLAALRPRSGTD